MQDDTQVDNDNVQGTQAQAQGDAVPVEEAVSPPAGAAITAEFFKCTTRTRFVTYSSVKTNAWCPQALLGTEFRGNVSIL